MCVIKEVLIQDEVLHHRGCKGLLPYHALGIHGMDPLTIDRLVPASVIPGYIQQGIKCRELLGSMGPHSTGTLLVISIMAAAWFFVNGRGFQKASVHSLWIAAVVDHIARS
jgi:hypothetical protein